MSSSDDMVKRLRSDRMYREALKVVGTDDDRRLIIGTAEGLLSRVGNALDVLRDAVRAHVSGSMGTSVVTSDDTRG